MSGGTIRPFEISADCLDRAELLGGLAADQDIVILAPSARMKRAYTSGVHSSGAPFERGGIEAVGVRDRLV